MDSREPREDHELAADRGVNCGGWSECPHCGSLAIRSSYIRDGQSVGCSNCGASVRAYEPDALRKASDLWNLRRPSPVAESTPTDATAVEAEREAGIECHGLDTPERVCFYEQDFYVLSNFSSFMMCWEGLWFPTSEHLYHWLKFATSPDGRSANYALADKVSKAISAHEAFKVAERNRSQRRPDWDDVKVEFMRRIVRAKADQHEYVRRKLLATGERELVENSWRDDFWGWGPNRDGQNMLGKLWMEVRDELRARTPKES